MALHSTRLALETVAVRAFTHSDMYSFYCSLVYLKLKFYYVETAKDLRVSPISPELRKAMKRVVNHLASEAPSSANAPKQYYHCAFEHMFLLWRHWMSREADSFPRLLTNNQGEASGLLELAKKLIGYSAYTLAAILKLLDEQVLPPVQPQWAERLTQELSDDLIKKLGTDGVLLFPSAPHTAPYHYSLYLRPFNFSYWGIFNALKFPAAQVPLGLDGAECRWACRWWPRRARTRSASPSPSIWRRPSEASYRRAGWNHNCRN